MAKGKESLVTRITNNNLSWWIVGEIVFTDDSHAIWLARKEDINVQKSQVLTNVKKNGF